MKHLLLTSIGIAFTAVACQGQPQQASVQTAGVLTGENAIIKPFAVTEPVPHDTDDPAVWINPADPAKSLIIGTDKDQDGGLYVFDLNGKMQPDKVVRGLKRPDNVDVEYGLLLHNKPTDIAVTTERFTHKLRIFSLPNMKPVDGGGWICSWVKPVPNIAT